MTDINGNNNLRASVQELLIEVAVLKSRLDEARAALGTQAKEYERRLHELNNAHQRAEFVAKAYITREVHDQVYKELSQRILILSSDIVLLKEDIANNKGKSTTIFAGFAGFVALLGLIIGFWHSFGR